VPTILNQNHDFSNCDFLFFENTKRH